MKNLSGKIIEARSLDVMQDEIKIGSRLRELRRLSGLTQIELSQRLGVCQTSLSRIENRSDIRVSTLKKYIEALDATLQIDAALDLSSPVDFCIRNEFDINEVHEDKLLLPILEKITFQAHRDFVLSIKPQYSEPILNGSKTVELRRRFPVNVPRGTLAYIYSTSPTRALTGVAEINAVQKKPINTIWSEYSAAACIKKADFENYFSGLDAGYVIQFENAHPLRGSLGLAELRERFGFEAPQSFSYAKPVLRETLKDALTEISN